MSETRLWWYVTFLVDCNAGFVSGWRDTTWQLSCSSHNHMTITVFVTQTSHPSKPTQRPTRPAVPCSVEEQRECLLMFNNRTLHFIEIFSLLMTVWHLRFKMFPPFFSSSQETPITYWPIYILIFSTVFQVDNHICVRQGQAQDF